MAKKAKKPKQPAPKPGKGAADDLWKNNSLELRAKGWTPKQRIFVAAHLRGAKHAAALQEAGYKVKPENASAAGTKILALPHIAEFLKDYHRERMAELKLGPDEWDERIAVHARSSLAPFMVFEGGNWTGEFDFSHATKDQLDTIEEIRVETYLDGKGEDAQMIKSVKLKVRDPGRFLEMSGKRQKLFSEHVEHSGHVTVTKIERVIVRPKN